ncbi:MAG: tyrosine-type recombinase/integrase [Oscillospiraceae bacterium]
MAKKRANGESTAYKLPNGRWRAKITLGWDIVELEDGTKKKKRIVKTKSGFKTKREALEWIKQYKSQDDPIVNITFKELYDLWSKPHFKKVSKSTADGYRAAYKHCESIYWRQFNQLKTADLQKVVDDCPYGRRTKADIKSLMNNLYKYAIENDYINKNYAEFIKLEKKPKSKKDAFTLDERNKLWQDYENGNDFTGYILVMIYTGMRYGELAKITKDNIYLNEQYMIGGIKTDAGINRTIPINDRILPIVKKFYNANKKKLLEMHEKVFYNTYYATLERLGIRRLNPHCCRHTFATMMALAEIQPAIITATAGHSDYQTTLQYTHIPLSEQLKAVNSLV